MRLMIAIDARSRDDLLMYTITIRTEQLRTLFLSRAPCPVARYLQAVPGGIADFKALCTCHTPLFVPTMSHTRYAWLRNHTAPEAAPMGNRQDLNNRSPFICLRILKRHAYTIAIQHLQPTSHAASSPSITVLFKTRIASRRQFAAVFVLDRTC